MPAFHTENAFSALENIGRGFAKLLKDHESDFEALIAAEGSGLTVKDVQRVLIQAVDGELDSLFLDVIGRVSDRYDAHPFTERAALMEAA